jgi:hypothetical protein
LTVAHGLHRPKAAALDDKTRPKVMSLDLSAGLANASIPSSYTAKGNHMLEKQVENNPEHLSIGARARLLV